MTKKLMLRLARIALSRRGFWAIALASSSLFGTIAALAFLAVMPFVNQQTLRSLDAQLLRRAELSIDYALIALSELIETGDATCTSASIPRLQDLVYRYSVIKDVRIYDSLRGTLCSANPEKLDFDPGAGSVNSTLSSVNQRIGLFQVDQGAAAVGVRWHLGDTLSLDAIVSTSSLLFDILPEELRENSSSSLRLSSGQLVAESTNDSDIKAERIRRTLLTSKRYPITASIRVDADTLARANRRSFFFTLAFFTILGFGLGIFVAMTSVHNAGPVAEIDLALARAEFVPFVQPIFSLTTRQIVGVEVLARWLRPDGTSIPPDRFIAVAEASERIVPLTWLLAKGALSALQPHLSKDRLFKVAFNIAPSQLLMANFVAEFRRITVDARVSPRQIVVEITERQEITDVERTREVLTDLRDCGYRIAFDDVGTGHSGLSYLQTLPADIVKIDKFLVDSIATSHSAKVLVEMLVRVSRELSMTTVAEGVETEEQAEVLRICGVDQGQGYLLSRPVPIGDLLERLLSSTNASSVQADGSEGSARQSIVA